MKDMMDIPRFDVILIDAMNLCHKMSYTMRDLSHKGHPTGMIYGVFKKIFKLKQHNPGAEIIFLWEGTQSKRKHLSKSYKSHRKGHHEDFQRSVDELRGILKWTGAASVFHYGLEADDMAGYLCDYYGDVQNILLISNDEDWLQFVRANVYIQRNSRGGTESEADLLAGLGFHPSKMGLWKVLRGDRSDGIRGIYKIPAAVIRMLVNKCEGWEQFKDYPLSRHNPAWENWEEKIKDNQELLKANAELILYNPEWVNENQVEWEHGEFDKDKLMELFDRYNFVSLRKEIECLQKN